MSKITIEFFHDAVCGWCYVISPRLRKYQNDPDIQFVQRSFVLQRNQNEMIERFGSMELAKSEILKHWQACQARADDPSRFNIEGMRAQPFHYPSGYRAAVAAKAAEVLGGQQAHWDFFDEIQHRHLKLNQNIADENVLIEAALTIGLDKQEFLKLLYSEHTHSAVDLDNLLAREYQIATIPTIVINGRRVISDTLTQTQLDHLIDQIKAQATTQQAA